MVNRIVENVDIDNSKLEVIDSNASPATDYRPCFVKPLVWTTVAEPMAAAAAAAADVVVVAVI